MSLKRKGALVLLAATVLAGCAARLADYGNIRPSDEVSQLFQRYEVLPGLDYYYSGPDAYPNFIIGIDKAFTLQSDYWKPVDLTPERLNAWINFMGQRALYRTHRYGADIVGPGGEDIGVWYSVRDWQTQGTVQLKPDNIVVISIPQKRPPRLFKQQPVGGLRTDGGERE